MTASGRSRLCAIPSPGRKSAHDVVAGYAKGRVPRDVRERQLLEVAERCFAEYGYQATSLEMVAREAGVTRQYLGKLFGDRDGLYLACHRRARSRLDAKFLAVAEAYRERAADLDHRALLEAGATAFFTFVRDHGAGWDVLFGSGSAVAGAAISEAEALRTQTVALIVGLLRLAAPAMPEAEQVPFAHLLSGGGTQLAKWWRTTDLPVEEVVDLYVSLYWSGLEPYAQAARSAGRDASGARSTS